MPRKVLPMNNDRFSSGFSWPGYVAQMNVNRELTRKLFDEITLDTGDREVFTEAVAHHGRQIYVTAMTEDWCGDAVANLPVIARLAAEVRNLELRLFLRSINPDLQSAYAADGIEHIPVVSFFDANWREIGRWVERPAAAQDRINAWMVAHPEVEALRQSNRPEDRERLKRVFESLLEEMLDWYREGLWQATLDELKARLHWSGLIKRQFVP